MDMAKTFCYTTIVMGVWCFVVYQLLLHWSA